MKNLRQHEKIVIDILTSGIISAETINDIKKNPTILSYDVTGKGYFITVQHPNLPKERIICDKPIVIGVCNGIETAFVIFIENNQLTFECHGWGNDLIPRDYRELNIKIKKA